jgi:site-specific DNA-methyltransferase (adenine-specific)
VCADGITLIHGDCRETLPQLEPVNCTVTSPPYNQRLETFKASGFKKEGTAQWAERISSSYFDSMDEDDYLRWQSEIIEILYAVTQSDGSLFYNHKCRWRDCILLHPLDIVRGTSWNIRQEIIWARDGSLTQNARMFPPSEERVIWCYKDKWKWNEDSNRYMSVWRIDSEALTPHPVAYPLQIPKRAIAATTELGDLVLDPFAGSGTTLVAAKQLGRKCIGIEIEEKYCEIAAQRLRQSVLEFGDEVCKPSDVLNVSQPSLFLNSQGEASPSTD